MQPSWLTLLLLCLVAGLLRLGDTSSSPLEVVANATYEKVFPCMSAAWHAGGRNVREWRFPADAEFHFEELKNKTARFRQAPVHEYANYEGPWIENIWIQQFLHRPLSSFGGFIPLFIQWIDTQILRRGHFDAIHNELQAILRPNVLYLAISQGDVGLGKIGTAHPNIMVLSAGGYGHVPIPLIRGEINYTAPPAEYQQTVGFFGTRNQHGSTRPEMFAQISAACAALNISLRLDQGPTWQRDMCATKFNLAPRGYGRSSFRYAESIQLGRMPVFLWDDYPWVPYLGTNLSAEVIGLSAGLRVPGHPLREVVERIHNMTAAEEAGKMALVREARWHFTYPGLVHQFEAFMRDPFGPQGGNLRCSEHPKTEK